MYEGKCDYANWLDVGYSEMEFAGYFDHSAKEIKQLLDDNSPLRLRLIQLDAFDTKLTQILDDAQTVGHKYLVVRLSEAQRGTELNHIKPRR